MSDEIERGQFEKANQALGHTGSPGEPKYNIPAGSNRPWLAGMNGPTRPRNAALLSPGEPSRPADLLKRLTPNEHSGWLVTTLVLILLVTMSLSFGFVKGWLDAKVTLAASVVFLVLLFGAMLVAHWPSRNPR